MNYPGHKFSLKNLIKLTLTSLCFSGLIYQLQILLNDFKSGNTVVSIRVGRQDYESLPALTLCTSDVFSYYRLVNNDSFFREKVNIYFNKIKELGIKSTQEEIFTNLTMLMNDYIGNTLNLSATSAANLMQDYSVKYPLIGFRIFIVGSIPDLENQTEYYINSYSDPSRLPIATEAHIESVHFVSGPNGKVGAHKCFTFFSSLLKQWRDFLFKPNVIEFKLFPSPYRYPYHWLPNPNLLSTFSFFIHSPNILPDYNTQNYITVGTDEAILLHYSQIKTELLSSGYDTNCFDYDLDYNNTQYFSRSGCISSCVKNFCLVECQSEDIIISDRLFSINWLRKYSPSSKFFNPDTQCLSKTAGKYNHFCHQTCLNECEYRYYQYEIERGKKRFLDSDPPIVKVKHSHLPDMQIKHIPQMTFISFVCNFGGLLGMWLGLSFLTIADEIVSLVLKITSKHLVLFGKFNFNVNPTINLNFNTQIHKFVKRPRSNYELSKIKWNEISVQDI